VKLAVGKDGSRSGPSDIAVKEASLSPCVLACWFVVLVTALVRGDPAHTLLWIDQALGLCLQCRPEL
jgi:hypothetical protein